MKQLHCYSVSASTGFPKLNMYYNTLALKESTGEIDILKTTFQVDGSKIFMFVETADHNSSCDPKPIRPITPPPDAELM